MLAPALVVAGTHSGVGKTTITTALLAAYRRRGLDARPFKVGPDFVDPTLHARAARRSCSNLDGWMLDAETNRAVFARAARGGDIALVEGVMGLFDGRDALTDAGSTAEIAKLLGAPVLLVVDGSALARSAAALVRGFETFDPDLDVAGVVFDRVAGPGHFAYLADAVRASCRARVVGWLPADDAVAIPERHLGLVTGDEILTDAKLDALARWATDHLDLDAVRALARPATDVAEVEPAERAAVRARVGVARDRAFRFAYRENLEALEAAGAELVAFSPVEDARLPERLDGLYLCGGYPELHAAALAANRSMREDVAAFSRAGRPVYAECGGFMYLTRAIVDADGHEHEACGLFPTVARMRGGLAAIGYREVSGVDGDGWLRAGETARGHEFRHSDVDPMPDGVERRYAGGCVDGYRVGATLASYAHLHFLSAPRFAERFVDACARGRAASA